MPWKCQESCIRTQCFTKNVLDIVSTRLCFIHELWERVGMNSPHTNSHPQSPHFRFEKQIETGQTWCFCTKKKIDWAEATAKAYKWRLWNTGFWLAESIWSQPMALALPPRPRTKISTQKFTICGLRNLSSMMLGEPKFLILAIFVGGFLRKGLFWFFAYLRPFFFHF